MDAVGPGRRLVLRAEVGPVAAGVWLLGNPGDIGPRPVAVQPGGAAYPLPNIQSGPRLPPALGVVLAVEANRLPLFDRRQQTAVGRKAGVHALAHAERKRIAPARPLLAALVDAAVGQIEQARPPLAVQNERRAVAGADGRLRRFRRMLAGVGRPVIQKPAPDIGHVQPVGQAVGQRRLLPRPYCPRLKVAAPFAGGHDQAAVVPPGDGHRLPPHRRRQQRGVVGTERQVANLARPIPQRPGRGRKARLSFGRRRWRAVGERRRGDLRRRRRCRRGRQRGVGVRRRRRLNVDAAPLRRTAILAESETARRKTVRR